MSKFDLSKLTESLDLDNLVSNVKSMINPEGGVINPKEGDALGQHIAEASHLAQEIAEGHVELAKKLKVLNVHLNAVFTELNPPEPKAKAEGEQKAAGEAKPEMNEAKVKEDKPAKPEDKSE